MWIAELWVDPVHRARGFGTCLLKAVLFQYRLRAVALSADPFEDGLDADTLTAWYARHGFHPQGGTRMLRPRTL
jgi:hypothetical protein